MKRVRVIFHRDAECWFADSPNIPGFQAGGETLDEARDQVRKSLPFFLGEEVEVVEEGLQLDASVPLDMSGWDRLFESLPGGEIVRKGFADLEQGAITAPALLLLIGGPRLRNLGLPVPHAEGNPEHLLYDLLAQHDSDSAHSRYNALIRTLVSFERAAECVKK